jgi:hypothetical protein
MEAFAGRLGLTVEEGPLGGAAAQLIRNGTRGTLVISDRLTDLVFRRFSIAHELGHFVLRHPTAPIKAGHRKTDRNYEAEANAFASELLMPEKLVREKYDLSKVDLEVPRKIAADYNVSVLASSIRFTELTGERCAAVFSAGGRVQWARTSAALTHSVPQRPLAPSSLAYSFFDRGALAEDPGHVPAEAWFETAAQVQIREHSMCSQELRTVLSILWVPPEIANNLS